MQADITSARAGVQMSTSLMRSITIYLELAKARLGTLVVLTTIAGYVLGARGDARFTTLIWTVLGTALTAFGANILNQVWEIERDRKMVRTRSRPLPAGRITRIRATVWGVTSSLLGLVVLFAGANGLTAALALVVILLYVFVYTPMKVRTPLNTIVGAVCGAVPPMMGWSAATGGLGVGAWLLGGVLFVWQMPHFMALAWLYREDYARGGFRMLPAVDPKGHLSGRVALIYAACLLPISAVIYGAGIAGVPYMVGAAVLTVAFSALAWVFCTRRTEISARRLFLGSIIYLPLLLGLMVANMEKRPHADGAAASQTVRVQSIQVS
jgi:protoheme IX farnesyltransferase